MVAVRAISRVVVGYGPRNLPVRTCWGDSCPPKLLPGQVSQSPPQVSPLMRLLPHGFMGRAVTGMSPLYGADAGLAIKISAVEIYMGVAAALSTSMGASSSKLR